MYININKTLEQIKKSLTDNSNLRKDYELMLRLQSQLLALIYDEKAFSAPAEQELLPYYEKAMVEIEIVTPKRTNNT